MLGSVEGLTAATSIVGMVMGTAGFTLGVLNYLRDRPDIKVSLSWDMKNTRTGAQIAGGKI
jgi:hypothetical protein